MHSFLTVLFAQDTLAQVNLLWDWIEKLVIISATLFTAHWTYQTFGHTEKVGALRNLLDHLESHRKSLSAYRTYIDFKMEVLEQTPQDTKLIESIEKLMSLDLQNLVKEQVAIEEIMERELNFPPGFRDKFLTTIKPLFEVNLTDPINIKQQLPIYNVLKNLIRKSSSIQRILSLWTPGT